MFYAFVLLYLLGCINLHRNMFPFWLTSLDCLRWGSDLTILRTLEVARSLRFCALCEMFKRGNGIRVFELHPFLLSTLLKKLKSLHRFGVQITFLSLFCQTCSSRIIHGTAILFSGDRSRSLLDSFWLWRLTFLIIGLFLILFLHSSPCFLLENGIHHHVRVSVAYHLEFSHGLHPIHHWSLILLGSTLWSTLERERGVTEIRGLLLRRGSLLCYMVKCLDFQDVSRNDLLIYEWESILASWDAYQLLNDAWTPLLCSFADR